MGHNGRPAVCGASHQGATVHDKDQQSIERARRPSSWPKFQTHAIYISKVFGWVEVLLGLL